jgi:hypothetical protein
MIKATIPPVPRATTKMTDVNPAIVWGCSNISPRRTIIIIPPKVVSSVILVPKIA